MNNDICFECGSENNIHYHHVVPKSLGGTNTIPLCDICHGKVHGEHMLKIQRLAAISRKKNIEKKKELGLPSGLGRKHGSFETINVFLNKEDNKIVYDLLEQKYTIKDIVKTTGLSNKTIVKINKYRKQGHSPLP